VAGGWGFIFRSNCRGSWAAAEERNLLRNNDLDYETIYCEEFNNKTPLDSCTVHVYSPTCLEVDGQRQAPAALLTEKRLSTHCTGGWVGSSTVWTGAEDLAHTLVRSPDCPARNESQNFTLLLYLCCI
jgi:hypothetical protein